MNDDYFVDKFIAANDTEMFHILPNNEKIKPKANYGYKPKSTNVLTKKERELRERKAKRIGIVAQATHAANRAAKKRKAERERLSQ